MKLRLEANVGELLLKIIFLISTISRRSQGTYARSKPQAPGAGDAPEEILAEVFSARPSDVEEMIRLRLEERSRGEDERWPEGFGIWE
jgi:hypothetical protein